LWDVTNGELVRTFEQHRGNVGDIAFSSDGRVLVAAGGNRFPMMNKGCGFNRAFPVRDDAVVAWSVSDASVLWTSSGPPGGTWDIAFSPLGDRFAVLNTHSCEDSVVWLYAVRTGSRTELYAGYHDVSDIQFAPDGRAIFVRHGDGLGVLALSGGEWLDYRGGNGYSQFTTLGHVAASPSGEIVAFANKGTSVLALYCYSGGDCSHEVDMSSLQYSVVFGSGGQLILGVGEYPGVITIWGIPDG
jgi:WD40 repeat protein